MPTKLSHNPFNLFPKMFFSFPHIFLLLPIFHFYGNVDAIQGCAGFGWTLVDGECHKPFTYFVNQQQADELCKKVGAQMVSFLSQANGEMAKLASEEMKMLTMINPPANLASGKQNGVICKRAAVEKAALTAADTGCPDDPLKIQLKSESASSGQRSSSSASSSSSSGQRASSSSKRGETRHSGGYGVDKNNLVINIYGEEQRGARGSRKYLNQRNKYGNRMYEEFEESKKQNQKRGKKSELGGEEDEEEILIRREITKNGNGGGKENGRGGQMEMEMKKGQQKKNAAANSKSASSQMSESESESEDEESSDASSSSSSSSSKREEEASSNFAAQNNKSSSSHSSSSSSSSSLSKSEKFEEKEEMVEESEIEGKK